MFIAVDPDSGITGYGEAMLLASAFRLPAIATLIEDLASQHVVGHDPFDWLIGRKLMNVPTLPASSLAAHRPFGVWLDYADAEALKSTDLASVLFDSPDSSTASSGRHHDDRPHTLR